VTKREKTLQRCEMTDILPGRDVWKTRGVVLNKTLDRATLKSRRQRGMGEVGVLRRNASLNLQTTLVSEEGIHRSAANNPLPASKRGPKA